MKTKVISVLVMTAGLVAGYFNYAVSMQASQAQSTETFGPVLMDTHAAFATDSLGRPLVIDVVFRNYSDSTSWNTSECPTLCQFFYTSPQGIPWPSNCPIPVDSTGNFLSYWITIYNIDSGDTLTLHVVPVATGPLTTFYITADDSDWLITIPDPDEDVLVVYAPGSRRRIAVTITFHQYPPYMSFTDISSGYAGSVILDCTESGTMEALTGVNRPSTPRIDAQVLRRQGESSSLQGTQLLCTFNNPVVDQLEVQVSANAAGAGIEITLWTVGGRPVATRKIPHAEMRTSFSVAELPAGMYVLTIRAADGRRQSELVVVHP